MTSGKPSVWASSIASGSVSRQTALRHVEADRAHRVLEQLAVFGHLDGLDRRADQLDAVLLERAGVGEIDGEVERGLAADGRQDRVGPLLLDDRGQEFRRQRLDVGAVGELGVGHDRRRVAVDEHDFEPFGAQRLARLRAGVVELAGLADDDRSGADDENALEVGSSWHLLYRRPDLQVGRSIGPTPSAPTPELKLGLQPGPQLRPTPFPSQSTA